MIDSLHTPTFWYNHNQYMVNKLQKPNHIIVLLDASKGRSNMQL